MTDAERNLKDLVDLYFLLKGINMSASPVTSTVQNAMYIAINLQNMLYGASSGPHSCSSAIEWCYFQGAEIVLYFETIHAVLAVQKKWGRPEVLHVLFSTVMLILVTIWVSTNAIFGEEMWLIHSDYPGGASEYWVMNMANWYLVMARAAVLVLQLMTDALLVRPPHDVAPVDVISD